MRFLVRSACIMILNCAVTLIITGCGKHPPAADPGPAPLIQTATPADKQIVVAKVNGVELNRADLDEVLNRVNAAKKRPATPEANEAARKKALDLLVLEELAVQEARRQKLSLGEKGLDNAMEKLQARLGHEEGYKNYLAKENITDAELRSRVERSLLIQIIFDKEVVKKTVVPEEEARAEYEQHKDRYRTPERIKATDVILFLDQNDPASMQKAAEVLSRINADKDKDPANLAVDGSFIVRPLDSTTDKEPALYDAARKLQRGELSGVISTPDSLHIIKLIEYTPERQLQYEEAKGLIEWSLRAQAQQKRRQEWERELKHGAVIELVETPRQQQRAQP